MRLGFILCPTYISSLNVVCKITIINIFIFRNFTGTKFVCVRYHVPRSWFKASGNVLVIFEEKGGDPTQIRFSKRNSSSFCGHVSEDQPSFKIKHLPHNKGVNEETYKATLELKCPMSSRISAVKFASFGTPTGTCGSYAEGDCHDPNSNSLIEKVPPHFLFFIYITPL